MIFNIAIGVLIFGYAAWTLARYVRKTKEGKCAGCSSKRSCRTACSDMTGTFNSSGKSA